MPTIDEAMEHIKSILRSYEASCDKVGQIQDYIKSIEEEEETKDETV